MSAPASIVPPSESQLRAESVGLPAGWVVGWSKSNGRRFWAKAPTATTPEIKQWEPPAQPIVKPPPTPASPVFSAAPAESPVSAVSPSSSSSLPHFEAWKPPSSSSLHAQSLVVSAIAAELAIAAQREKDQANTEMDDAEKERTRSEAEQRSKKRRVGLGFDRRQKVGPGGAGGVRFVAAGGAPANTPAATAAAFSTSAAAASSSSSSAPIDAVILPSNPSRLQSASYARCTVTNPPVYSTSYSALAMLTRGPASTPSEWSDPVKYAEIVDSASHIIATQVYGVSKKEDITEELLRAYLSAGSDLPPPVSRVFTEESPTLINARRAAFNELDTNLTRFVREVGLREQPSMAFLRWGFNQRSLQNPKRVDEQDPLLPMDAGVDACLTSELVREKLNKETAREVCLKLAAACKTKAAMLVKMKTRLESSTSNTPASLAGKFELLLPHESHLHTFKTASAHGDGGSSAQPYRERDLNSFNQSEREQYKIIYDRGGPSEHAIPLNHARFTQLRSDYIRSTGPIRADLKEDTEFLRRLWTMCARYDTISGAGYQAALPEEGFAMLKRHWGVEHECYASPLNHCLESFGSAFIETDRFFGSKGQR